MVTLEPVPWLDWFEDEDELSDDEDELSAEEESFDVEESSEEVESPEDDELDPSSVDDEPAVLVSVALELVPCDALLAAVLPREPVAEMIPKEIANVASAAAATRRRIWRARSARARRRSRTRSEVWF